MVELRVLSQEFLELLKTPLIVTQQVPTHVQNLDTLAVVDPLEDVSPTLGLDLVPLQVNLLQVIVSEEFCQSTSTSASQTVLT